MSKFCRRQTPQQVPVSLSSSIFLHQTSGVPAVADDSIGYVSLEILVRLSVQEGSLAVLSRSQGDSSTVVLRLRLLSDESQSNLNILQVSPIVETNLGIISTSTSGGENNNHEGFCLQGIYDEPRFAQEVVLRPLGRPPSWPEFWKDDDEEDDDSWIFPPSNTRVQPYHLLSVYDSKHEKVYYYEVLKIVAEQQQEVMNDYDDSTACFLTSSSTKFQLDSAPLSSMTRRLPPLISHLQFYQGCKINSNVVAPYPNLSQLKTALASIFSTSASCPQVPPASQLLRSDIPKIRSNEKILHIIGTYHEHNVRNVVETAARQVGMQCLSIRGLASFAHHQGEVVSTGSLVDQLAGLQAALDMIQSKRMEPCVLHLYDLDDELSRDVPQRHEEEKRFWAKLMLALEGNGPEKEECNKNGKFLYTPKLMIVISTSAPLKPGPWMEKLGKLEFCCTLIACFGSNERQLISLHSTFLA